MFTQQIKITLKEDLCVWHRHVILKTVEKYSSKPEFLHLLCPEMVYFNLQHCFPTFLIQHTHTHTHPAMLLSCTRTTGPILIWKILVRASFPCTVIDSNSLILLSVRVWMKNDISMGSQIYSECGVLEVRG